MVDKKGLEEDSKLNIFFMNRRSQKYLEKGIRAEETRWGSKCRW